VLHAVRPAHRLIAADFDTLPDVIVAGTNAPLVASKRDGKTHDHSTYIVPRCSHHIPVALSPEVGVIWSSRDP
jgi:hypothetical protein